MNFLSWLKRISLGLILAILLLYAAVYVFRAYQFWYAPTTTALGANTTQHALNQIILANWDKGNSNCNLNGAIFLNLMFDISRAPELAIHGYKHGTLPFYEIPLFLAETPFYSTSRLLWAFSESGSNNQLALRLGIRPECIKSNWVLDHLDNSEFAKEYLSRAGIESQKPYIISEYEFWESAEQLFNR